MAAEPKPKPIPVECQSCKDHWDSEKKPRKKLVFVGSTQNMKLAVLICPYCDGERAIKLAKAKPKK